MPGPHRSSNGNTVKLRLLFRFDVAAGNADSTEIAFRTMIETVPASILLLVWPEASAYNSTFQLSRILQGRGHKVVYATPQRWELYVSRQGFETVFLDASAPLVTRPIERGCFSVVRQKARERLNELQRSMDSIGNFDLVLLHPTLWHYALVLRRLGIPYLSANSNLGSTWNLRVPPIFSGLQSSPRRLLNGLRCGAAWLALRYFGAFAHRYWGIIQPKPDGLGGRIRDVSIAAGHFVHSVFEPSYMPVYYRILRTARREGVLIRWGDYGHRLLGTELVFGPRAIDFFQDHHPGRRVYAGISVDTARVEDNFDWSLVDPRKPLVFCAIGSHGGYWNTDNRVRLLESVVQSFRTHPERQLLLQTADEEERARLAPLPGNVVAASWYPQLQVLARTSVFISHGGFGSVREALFFGVPMIIFPFGVDQPGNAARVTRCRAGLSGDIRTVTADTISSMLQAVERLPFRENAVRLSKVVRIHGNCEDAVAEIEGACVDHANGLPRQEERGLANR